MKKGKCNLPGKNEKRKKENEPETALLYLLLSCLQHRLERRKTLVSNLWQNSSAVWAKRSLEIGN